MSSTAADESYDPEDYYDESDYGNVTMVTPCTWPISSGVSTVVGPYIHPVICVLGFVGNGLVIATYSLYKRTKSMTDVYLLNVAVADVLFVLSLPLLAYNELSSWSMGPLACKLLRGSYSVNLYSGALLLACISADRYVAIVQARRSFRLRSLFYGRLVCVAVWVSALLLSVPTFYFYQRYVPGHSKAFMINGSRPDPTPPTPPRFVCEFRSENREVALSAKVAIPAVQLAVGFFLPLLVMVFCYTAVVVTLTKAKNFQRHKAVRVVLAVVAVFVLCHLPYNAALLYDTARKFRVNACGSTDALQTSLTVVQSVAYLHCCLNPVLYAFVGVKFRNHFRRIFRDLWCLGKRYITPRRFSRVTSEMYVSSVRRSADGSSDAGTSFTM